MTDKAEPTETAVEIIEKFIAAERQKYSEQIASLKERVEEAEAELQKVRRMVGESNGSTEFDQGWLAHRMSGDYVPRRELADERAQSEHWKALWEKSSNAVLGLQADLEQERSHSEKMAEALKGFVARVDNGEIRSYRTYSRFKELIEAHERRSQDTNISSQTANDERRKDERGK